MPENLDLYSADFPNDPNHYIFRELRIDKNINKLKKRLQNGETVTPQLLNYYTKTLLPYFIDE